MTAHRTARMLAVVAGLTGSVAPALHAQGALSTLGFGYPSGQLSTRALGAGGALAEFDPNSPLNPASLVGALRALVYLQYDPEFRNVNSGGQTASTLTARFPLFGVTGRIAGVNIGLTFSSFLDRTWTNTYSDTETLGGQRVPSTVTAQSNGGVNDVRLAASYTIAQNYHVGLGFHVFPGENRILIGRDFPDSTQIGSFTQADIFNFSGSAFSFGVLATPVPHWNLALSGRVGGPLRMRAGDSTIVGAGHVPDRWSGALAYDGFAGSALSVRYVTERWSALRGLGSAGLPISDATEFAAGAEVAGPKVSNVPMAMRVGFRARELPFSLGVAKVEERSLSAGLGLPVSNGRGSIDLSVVRAQRSAAAVRETGWTVSFGLGIKP
ncbi:MAG: hypothetical protein ACHQQ3_13235 [Gemmatimonadales bacterium]